MIFGVIPPPRNFAKIHARGGRGLLPVQPKDSIPPWGHTGARRARRGRFAPESSGRRRTGGGVPRRARRGRFSPWRRGQGAVPGRGGRRRGKMAAPSAACVGFQATSAIEAAGGRKSPFLPYKEALFPGRGSCQIRAVLRPNPCRFGRVAFSAAQSDECVTPGGAGEKPRRKTKRPSERSAPHEKPDFRYRD